MAAVLAMAGALLLSSGLVVMTAPAASAENGNDNGNDPKVHRVYVCKYVGTPGVDERLQTGNNPIAVDTNALGKDSEGREFTAEYPDTSQFDFSFSDGQGRSVAFAWDDIRGGGQNGEPTTDDCPAAQGPSEVTPGVGFTDPDCPPAPAAGSWAATVNGAADGADDGVTFSAQGSTQPGGTITVTATAAAGHVFAGGETTKTFSHTFKDFASSCTQTATIPGAPATTDQCGPNNISFVVPADTDALDWTLLGNGNLTVAPKPGFKFDGENQLVTYTLPADSNIACPVVAGVQEIAPVVSFTDPTCNDQDVAWSGTFTDIVDYTVSGDAAPGGDVVVTASIKAAQASAYAFPAGYDTTTEHSFPTIGSLNCEQILGEEETKGPKPTKQPQQDEPVVLGTQAAVPTAVDAGLATVAAPAEGGLLGRALTVGGLGLLLAAGWLVMGRRELGAREI